MKINSEDKKDITFSMYFIIATIIFSVASILIQFDLKDEISPKVATAIMLNTFATILLIAPIASLFLILLDKRIKERWKEANDEKIKEDKNDWR